MACLIVISVDHSLIGDSVGFWVDADYGWNESVIYFKCKIVSRFLLVTP